MSRPPVLAVHGLRKAYGDVVALEGIDLEVAPGECVALIGHNGSGKTTTMRLAAGQDEPVVGLDPPSQEMLRELLAGIKADGIAIVLTTHQLAFSEGLADRAVVLHDGRVVDAGDYAPVVAGAEATRLGL